MQRIISALSCLSALLLAVSPAVWAEPDTTCTAYCQTSGANGGHSGLICHLPGENGMPAPLAQHCLNQPGASLPIPVPEDLQQRLLAGEVGNPFRAQYPLAAGVNRPIFNHTTIASLQAIPLQLDDDDRTEEWLVYQSSPADAPPPYFWIIQFRGSGQYDIVLEHAGQMVWIDAQQTEGFRNLRTARFANLDQGGQSGSFTDVREWQFTNGFYSMLKATGMAVGPVEHPEPVM